VRVCVYLVCVCVDVRVCMCVCACVRAWAAVLPGHLMNWTLLGQEALPRTARFAFCTEPVVSICVAYLQMPSQAALLNVSVFTQAAG
jgi:hypothetical protein